MNTYEVEVKVLLWSQKNAESLIHNMKSQYADVVQFAESKQLNYYFLRDWDFEKLFDSISKLVEVDEIERLRHIMFAWKGHSIRARQSNDDISFVVKAVADDTSAENGIARVEFDSKIDGISLDQLDKIILDSGFSHQSKWSRYRKEFKYKDFNVCLDKNAGYWRVAEFEKIAYNESEINEAKMLIMNELEQLGLEELDQGRLDRMFQYYNNNWTDYYGTDKTFLIE